MIWISLIIAILAIIISSALAYVVIIRLQEQDDKNTSFERDINNLREALHLLNKELRYERKR